MRDRRPFPWAALLAGAALFFYATARFYHALFPFLVSLVVAYALNPVVAAGEARGLRRGVIVAALYVGAGILVVLAVKSTSRMIVDDVGLWRSEFPSYVARGRRYFIEWQREIIRSFPYATRLMADWDFDRAISQVLELGRNASEYVLGIFPIFSFLLLIPLLTFFLLMDGPRIIGKSIQLCPSGYVEQALHLLSAVDAAIGGYLQGLVLAAAAITIASLAGLEILGVNQALPVAMIAGLTSFIPYVGIIAGAAIGGLAAWFQFGTVVAGLKVVALFAAIKVADDAVLEPYLARHMVQLHPLILLLVLILGGELFGFAGLVLAVPVACVVKAVAQVLWDWYSTEARLRAPDVPRAVAVPYL